MFEPSVRTATVMRAAIRTMTAIHLKKVTEMRPGRGFALS
jgi:hypothetical protein